MFAVLSCSSRWQAKPHSSNNLHRRSGVNMIVIYFQLLFYAAFSNFFQTEALERECAFIFYQHGLVTANASLRMTHKSRELAMGGTTQSPSLTALTQQDVTMLSLRKSTCLTLHT